MDVNETTMMIFTSMQELLRTAESRQIVDMSKSMMLIQMCDIPDRIQLFIGMFKTISIVEVARTGTLALQKCMETD